MISKNQAVDSLVQGKRGFLELVATDAALPCVGLRSKHIPEQNMWARTGNGTTMDVNVS